MKYFFLPDFFNSHPFPVPSNSISHFSLTCTLKFGFLVTGSQRLSSAHLLWLKLLKNNWGNHGGVPYHQYTCWTAESLHPFLCLLAPSGLDREGTFQHFHTLPSQVKRKHTHSNPSAISGFQEARLPSKMISLCFKRVLYFIMDDETL